MPTFDPRIIALFCLLFIGLGVFSIFTGRRRLLEGRAQGLKLAWYKQVGILTGIEYILLAITFLMSISVNAGWLPKSWGQLLVPLYIVMLFASLLLAGIVIYQGFAASRRSRQTAPVAKREDAERTSKPVTKTSTVEKPEREMTAEERATSMQKRRERRQKAAQARRRRAGKA
jgi:hypothetical protein